jgi:hypothetical protein
MVDLEVDTETSCLEDRLRSLGILSSGDDLTLELTVNSVIKGIDLEADIPQKKVCLFVYLFIYFFCLPIPKIKNQDPTCTMSLFSLPLTPTQQRITLCS